MKYQLINLELHGQLELEIVVMMLLTQIQALLREVDAHVNELADLYNQLSKKR